MPITLGLISDTHIPDRCRALPAAVFDALAGVDLILHAGDVGALHVLDELSQIAPVIAVHGNDELEGAPDVLPTQQVLFLAGRRILLTHGNYPNRADEHAHRKIDDWHPKVVRWAGLAREVGASMIIYGHTHIPWAVEVDGIWVINPGAIASGNHLMRQRIQTVARLTLDDSLDLTYVDLADLSRYDPLVDINAGFTASTINDSIATPDLLAQRSWVFHELYNLAPDGIMDAVRRVMFRCLDGEIPQMDIATMQTEILNAPDIPHEVKELVRVRFG